MVMRGDRLANGSWKIYCILRRWRRSGAALSLVISTPSNLISPDVGSIRRSTERPIVVLPLTRIRRRGRPPRRAAMSKEISSSALTTGPRENAVGAKCLVRFADRKEGSVHCQSSCQRMQRLCWVDVAANNGGTAVRQASTARAQRGAKAQPLGSRARMEHCRRWSAAAFRPAFSAVASPSRGTERISPAV